MFCSKASSFVFLIFFDSMIRFIYVHTCQRFLVVVIYINPSQPAKNFSELIYDTKRRRLILRMGKLKVENKLAWT